MSFWSDLFSKKENMANTPDIKQEEAIVPTNETSIADEKVSCPYSSKEEKVRPVRLKSLVSLPSDSQSDAQPSIPPFLR